MKFSHSVDIDVSADEIDLPDWIFGMSDTEYQRCAKGHRAMGIEGGGDRSGMVNVESIGGSLLIQHYETQLLRKDHVSFVSGRSRAYLMHLFPIPVRVGWDMQVSEVAGGKSNFRCAIEVVLPLPVRLAGPLIGTNHFIRQHLAEETRGFAEHLTSRFAPVAHAGKLGRQAAARAA